MKPILPVKGTRDFYPRELATRRWLYDHIRAVSEKFGYQEYDGPFLEKLELYAAKSGEELVKEQSFVFPDRGGEMIALRPELTPSLARMVAERSRSLAKPIRWWSFGPFWRYERPQKGRSREFFQWNIDLLGPVSNEADAEITAVAATFFKAIGLKPDQVKIHVNNRRLVDDQLAEIDIRDEARNRAYRLLDRREKADLKAWEAHARDAGFSGDQISGLENILLDESAWERSNELKGFFQACTALGVAEFFIYDPSVVRGLDYYTGTVYEAREASGEFRSIFGGGRYDDLVSVVGGDPVPGTGFAMGDMVILLVIEQFGLIPELNPNRSQVLVTLFDEQAKQASLQMAAFLRSHDISVEWFPQVEKLTKQVRYADKQGIPVLVFLGPEEIAADTVTIKDMQTGNQSTVAREDSVQEIRKILSLP